MKNCTRWLGMVGAALALVGCGDGDGDDCPVTPTMKIEAPSDGSVIVEQSDVDPGTPGIQVDVRVRAEGLADDDEVTLSVGDSVFGSAPLDGGGIATFAAVTLPAGTTTLRATADGACGAASDAIELDVVGEVACALTVQEGLIPVDFYDPVPVLNRSNDSDSTLPGFQAHLEVATLPGYRVELFVLDVGSGQENSGGTATADAGGAAVIAETLAEGRLALRATCEAPQGGADAASATMTVVVDVTAPACALTAPAGPSVTPDDDEDDAVDDTQVTLRGTVLGDDDTEGEPVTFSVGALDLAGTPVTAAGESTAVATFAAPGAIELAVAGQDHAGNACTGGRAVQYVTEGCAIAHVLPADVVADDGDATPGNGVQATLQVEVDPACVGQTLTTTCDATGPRAFTVPAGGSVSETITVCATAECETSYDCTSSVQSPEGIVTAAAATIEVDTRPPSVTFVVLNPPGLGCTTVGPEVDAQGDASDGVQIRVQGASPGATVVIEQTTDGGTTAHATDAFGRAYVTLAAGDNSLLARATDEHGNEGTSAPACVIRLEDLPVTFEQPIAGGLVGSDDGAIVAGGLQLDVCGTVGDAATAMVEISIDGGAPLAMTSIDTGTGRWCVADVVLPEGPPSVEIVATATAGAKLGSASVDVFVDLDAPGDPTGGSAVVARRNAIELSWTAPGDGGAPVYGYIVKHSANTALTNANFDVTGVEVLGPTPATPGTVQSFDVGPLRTGAPHWVGVAAVDEAGNRSAAVIAGPLTPDFTHSGAITPVGGPGVLPEADHALGTWVAGGDINGDGWSDVLVGAPAADSDGMAGNGADGLAYVYLGGPAGIGDAPDWTITPPAGHAGAKLGQAVAVIDWDGDGQLDLAFGAPGVSSFAGRVGIFYGGAAWDAPAMTTEVSLSDADVTISTAGSGWFGVGACGWSLDRARFDGNARDDLVIGCALADGFRGGAVVVYGGTATGGAIVLSQTAGERVGGASATLLRVPAATPSLSQFGTRVTNVGNLGGATDLFHDVVVSGAVDVAAGEDRVFVFHGGAAPASFEEIGHDLSLRSADVDGSTSFGWGVTSIPSLDGGSGRDLVIAEPTRSPGTVWIVDGALTGDQGDISAVALHAITGGNEYPGFGMLSQFHSAADVDGDGVEDLVYASGGGSPRLRVVFGADLYGPSPPTSAGDARIYAPLLPDAFTRVTGLVWVGDVNGDGLDDICTADDQGYSGAPGGMVNLVY